MEGPETEKSESRRIPIEEFKKEQMPLVVRFVYEMGIVFISLLLAAVFAGFMLLLRR